MLHFVLSHLFTRVSLTAPIKGAMSSSGWSGLLNHAAVQKASRVNAAPLGNGGLQQMTTPGPRLVFNHSLDGVQRPFCRLCRLSDPSSGVGGALSAAAIAS